MFKKNKLIKVVGVSVVVLLTFFAVSIFLLIRDDYKAMTYKDFVDFKTEQIFRNNRTYLLVSGQYYGSSLKIKNVKEERDSNDVVIKVYMTLFSKNNSAFLYPIELNSSVNRVLFGDEKKVIWEKN